VRTRGSDDSDFSGHTGSAKILIAPGFEALATTSAGFALTGLRRVQAEKLLVRAAAEGDPAAPPLDTF
jgi:hypothetical protein